jgi:IS30 family transposase
MGHGSGPAHRLTSAERLELLQRVRAGETHCAAAAAIGCATMTVQRVLRMTGGVKARPPVRSAFRLSLSEREEISRGLLAGDSCRMIATRLGRSPSTVSRDVATGGARQHYRAWRADEQAQRRAGRPKVSKLVACPRLRAEVERRLKHRWSPQQIAARLIREFPDEPEMRVSHETIYQSLFVQGRGALRRELTRCLRSGRAQRRPHGRVRGTGRLKDMILLSERPAEAEDRAIPGHWEGDLILGKLGQSAIGTLVERQTRYVMLVHLPHGRLAEDVKHALTKAIRTLPTHLRRSLTWDQGKEMGAHASFTVATGVQVYFCDPRSPWQRATSENSNGLLRQYFPKGTALAGYTQAQLNAVAMELNGRPRQTLGWDTPSQAFARVVAMTA